MCGIIGYTGTKSAEKIILDGLYALEYRGYDSAGMAIAGPSGKTVKIKCRGRVSELEKEAAAENCSGSCGIGHTRWATHGAPTKENAHPHSSDSLTLVHNGIIDNCLSIREELEKEGYVFVSDTDTECIAHLADREYKKLRDPAAALYSACSQLRGSYALAVIFNDRPNEVYAVRKDNPLILAIAEDGAYAASDIPALLPYSRELIRPGEDEVFCLRRDGAFFVSKNGEYEKRETEHFDLDVGAAGKDGYDFYMLKEIHEEPDAVFRTVSHRIGTDGLPDFSGDGIPDSLWRECDSVSVIGCGSATHAGLVGRFIIESLAGVPVTVNTASEYRYDPPATVGRTLALPISQSGETADTLAALRVAKQTGHRCVSVVNAVGSAVARESDYVIYEGAGPEIAVATTKGYTTQTALLAVVAVKLALEKGRIDKAAARELCRALSRDVPGAISDIISRRGEIAILAEMIKNSEDIYFIGRGPDWYAGSECSLKLKEISYIHSEAYAAGELKHGTLSLIENGTPVIALASDGGYYDKMCGNIREVRARGGFVILVCGEDFEEPEKFSDAHFVLPKTKRYFTPLATVVFAQLLAYETALLRGCDVDHPRNLAKSVTVE